MVVRGSKLVAKVYRKHYSIEHAQSISRSQRSSGTLGFYFAVAVFTYVQYKRRLAKYNTYNFKSYKYRHHEKASHGILLRLGWVRVHAQVAQIAASVVVR